MEGKKMKTSLFSLVVFIVVGCSHASNPAAPAPASGLAVTLVAADPVSGYVSGGSTQKIATYNFVSQHGSANVSELWFNAITATGVQSHNDLASVTVNGVTASVVNGAAHITGLSIIIPTGDQGIYIPVTATFTHVTSLGQGGAAAGDKFFLVMSDYKYAVGDFAMYGDNGSGLINDKINVKSDMFILAESFPIVALAADNPPGIATGYIGGVQSELMRFTVSNSGPNLINLKKITLTLSYSAILPDPTTQKIYVYDRNDLNAVLGSSAIGTSGVPVSITFANKSVITGNGSEEYVVKVDDQGSWFNAGAGSIKLQLSSADNINGGTDWQWNDSTIPGYLDGLLLEALPLAGNSFVY